MTSRFAAATPSSATAIAWVDEQRWLSFHAYCPGDRDTLLLQVVQPAIARLWAERIADRFFFIRYPEGGDHVRLRLRVAAGIATAVAFDRALGLLDAGCAGYRRTLRPELAERVAVIPALFEPEIERYGGPQLLPGALSFFALSSMDALRFVASWTGQSRGRQLIELLIRLARQAIGMARTAADLCELADYAREWRPHMAPILARADQMFENRGPELVQRIRELLAAATTATDGPPGSASASVIHARLLASSVDQLEDQARWRTLGSQMHMAANRFGLSPPEESYLSAILHRCLDALGDELIPVMARAAPVAPGCPAAALNALDSLAGAGMHALFDTDDAPRVPEGGAA